MKSDDFQLEITGLRAGYGGRTVLNGINLTVQQGERITLIGPNGCGKSTLFKVIIGLLKQQAGTVRFGSGFLDALQTEDRVGLGIGYLPQADNVFPLLTVQENLELARSGSRSQRDNGADRTERVLNDFPVLAKKFRKRSGLLSGGERQSLAMGMALMRRVRVLLLDEPIAGLSPKAGTGMMEKLDGIQQREGFAVMLVEHRLRQIQPHVDRVVVMRLGELVADTRDRERLTDADWLDDMYQFSPGKNGSREQ